MLTLWGKIEEEDIAAFAGTLILPSYMSHLQLTPFRFANQPRNGNGAQNLILIYAAPGRIEEFEVSPQEHALDLLCYTCRGLKHEMVRLPRQDAIWLWPNAGKTRSANEPVIIAGACEKTDADHEPPVMRLFFEPLNPKLDRVAPGPIPPEKAYLSISRHEIFVHIDVVAAYFKALFGTLGLESHEHQSCEMTCQTTPSGFEYSTPFVVAAWAVENDTVFQDLLRFAQLGRWLDQWESEIVPDLDSSETQILETGFRVKLSATNAKA